MSWEAARSAAAESSKSAVIGQVEGEACGRILKGWVGLRPNLTEEGWPAASLKSWAGY